MSNKAKIWIAGILSVYFVANLTYKVITAYTGVCNEVNVQEINSVNTEVPLETAVGVDVEGITVTEVDKSTFDDLGTESDSYIDIEYGLPVILYADVNKQPEQEYYVVVESKKCDFCKIKIKELVDTGATVYLVDADKEILPIDGVPYTYKVRNGMVVESKLGAN